MKKILIIAALLLLHLGVKGQNVYWDESVFCKTGILPISGMPAIRQLLSDEAGKITSIAFKLWAPTVPGVEPGYYLERRLPNGRLDQSFGTNGRIFISLSVRAGQSTAAVQPDGKILTAVSANIEGKTGRRTVLLRINTDGSLDGTFGDGGMIDFDFWGDNMPAFIAPSNDFFLRVGYSGIDPLIFKYKSDGTLDETFGEEGSVSIADFYFDWLKGLILPLKDGSLLCGGYYKKVVKQDDYNQIMYEFAVVKLNADGTLCAGFGNNGLASFDFATERLEPLGYLSYDCCTVLRVLEDGSILASGTTADPDYNVLLKLHADGALDTGFGDNGSVVYGYQRQHDMQVETGSGDIVIGGSPHGYNQPTYSPPSPSEYSYVITRFNKNGDMLFSEGLTKKEEGSPSCMALRADGRVWLGGTISGSTALGRITFDDDFGPAEDDCIGVDETVIEGPEIYAWNNGIVLAGTVEGEDITVYNAAGVMVATTVSGEGETFIPLSSGCLYIVKAGDKTLKIML